MMLTLLFSAPALAASLPGIPLSFEVDDEGAWRVPEEVPGVLSEAGAGPDWELIRVDGAPFDPDFAREMVVAGPARTLRLELEAPPAPPVDPDEPEVDPPDPERALVTVTRAPMVQVVSTANIPYPSTFSQPAKGWAEASNTGALVLMDSRRVAWSAADGETLQAVRIPGVDDRMTPEILWSLSDAQWALKSSVDDATRTGDSDWAKEALSEGIWVPEFGTQRGDFFMTPLEGGLEIQQVFFPRGTATLPVCEPAFPEACLSAGRDVQEHLAELPGADAVARSHFVTACEGDVLRGCVETVRMDAPVLADDAERCLEGDLDSCIVLAQKKAETTEEVDLVHLGVLRHTCDLESTGSLGERLRQVEDVGQGCMLLKDAYQDLNQGDQVLLTLDRACMLGHADACSEAEALRHQAFALRIVRECEDKSNPVGDSCVQLGTLLEVEEIAATELDAFDAFSRGCSLGAEAGCRSLGDYVDRWGIEHKRVRETTEALMQACKSDDSRACIGAGHLLVRHDPKSKAYGQALELFAGTCAGGQANGCVAGAQQRRIGTAKRVKAPSQVAMWDSACDLGDMVGCAGLGDALAKSKTSWPDAFEALSQACNGGDPASCTDLGKLVAKAREEIREGQKARDAYLLDGCVGGDPEGCYHLANDTGENVKTVSEPTYINLEKSCIGEYGPGCATLAEVHLARNTSFDEELAAQHFTTACDNSHFFSCRDVGMMYLKGEGVERDRQKSREFLDRFRYGAARRYTRLGLKIGFPNLAGGELEVVMPIPVGPALTLAVDYSYIPGAGQVIVALENIERKGDASSLETVGLTGRLYPNNKARGLYAALGAHKVSAVNGGNEEVPRNGWSARLGMRSDSKRTFAGMETGFGNYGVFDPEAFDDTSSLGKIPFVLPTFAMYVGIAAI